MKKKMTAVSATLCVCVLSLLGPSAFGAGFGLYEYSPRGNAMGGAVLAGEAEPASISYNPALITRLSGAQAQTAVTAITVDRVRVEFAGETSNPDKEWWFLPDFYYTQQLNERWFVGLGGFTRFGLSGRYPDRNWAGAQAANHGLYDVGIESFSIQPTLGYKVTENLSAAIAPEIMYFKFWEGTRVAANTDMDVSGDSWALGGALGAFYQANEKVSFGAVYRHRIKQHLKGTSSVSGALAPYMTAYNTNASGAVTLPAQLGLGVAVKLSPAVLLEFNWTNIFWSSFDELTINLDGVGSSTSKKEWKDTYRIGFGIEYAVSKRVKLRNSYIFDKSPINSDYMDVIVPVDNRHIIGMGVGVDLGKGFYLDLGYNLLLSEGKSGVSESGIPVEYGNGVTHLSSAGVRYKF